jgi:hypothetical protein
MNLELTVEYGSITAEIEATDEDDYTKVLEELAEFAEDHPEFVKRTDFQSVTNEPNQEKEHSESMDADLSKFSDESSIDSKENSNTQEVENDMLQPLLERLDVSEGDFIRTFEVAEDVTPRILAPEELSGETKSEQMLNAALILSTVWQDCYGREWLKSSDLSDALEQSGLGDRTDYIYNQDDWQRLLNKNGQGRGTKIKPTRLGEDRAEELIEAMVN